MTLHVMMRFYPDLYVRICGGEIPPSLGQLIDLAELSLEGNQLMGEEGLLDVCMTLS